MKETDKQHLMSRAQRLAEQGLTHSLKKLSGSKKRKKNGNGESSAAAAEESAATTSKDKIEISNKPSIPSSSGIRNASTAMLTAKVLGEEDERNKRQKMARSENLQSLFHSDKDRKKMKDGDFMTRGFSIPANARR